MGTWTKSPENVEELLRRYAAGERNFAGANLSGANLTGVHLRSANLSGANLSGANLSGADLIDANFCGANLARGEIMVADLRTTNFSEANLSETDLRDTNLRGANLARADLRRAFLRCANLSEAKLTGANLSGANLCDADLEAADLNDANFSEASASATRFVNVDLSRICDADPPVRHLGASPTDYRAIVKSVHSPKLKEFLQHTGMPEVFAEYMIDCARSLDPQGIFKMLQSTFISYGGPDTAFAQKLNDALLKNGVTTFFFAKDALPGKKLHRLMRDGVNQHDRVILVCSQASLDRPGVLNEITETLQREARDGGKEYLIPITLDEYVFSGWKPEEPGGRSSDPGPGRGGLQGRRDGPGQVQRGAAAADRSAEEVGWQREPAGPPNQPRSLFGGTLRESARFLAPSWQEPSSTRQSFRMLTFVRPIYEGRASSG